MSSKKAVLVCGASSGIGLALVKELLKNENCNPIHATCRDESKATALYELKTHEPDRLHIHFLEASREADFQKLAEAIESVDWVINSMGLLHNSQGLFPERKIEEFEVEKHLQVYQVNTLSTLLLAKHLKSLLRKSKSPLLAVISAKVGSLGDNRIGGWHSYRISKAAVNMAVKNLSIELGRLNPKTLCVALHPGTTQTPLSKPFMENAKKNYQVHTPEATAKNLLQVLSKLKAPGDNGQFYSWNGERLPW